MTIETLMEDLEAQAFFAKLPRKISENQKILSAIITVGVKDPITLHLTSPLVGKDFIAGFTLRNNEPAWIVITFNSLISLDTIGLDAEFLETELSLLELVEAKLFQVPLTIKLRYGVSRTGMILQIRGGLFEFRSAGNIQWFSVAALESLIVENLSNLA